MLGLLSDLLVRRRAQVVPRREPDLGSCVLIEKNRDLGIRIYDRFNLLTATCSARAIAVEHERIYARISIEYT